MCGIAGYVTLDGAPVDREVLANMAASLRHRGPDGEGITIIDNVGLAHRRLSIIDLAGGTQPMCSADGTVWVIFNGEIYNYKELRAEFESRGHIFRTASDTETILAAYAERGEDCVSVLRGMFAFALYDTRRRLLLLARDRFGIKPLYYCDTGKAFVFGSEIKALLQHPGVKRELDPVAVSDYLTYLYVPGPRSIFRNVSKLAPGATLVWRDGTATLQRYWEPTFEGDADSLSEHEWAELVREAVHESVRLHMRADVPYGVLLSGGLDSSTLVAFMAAESSQPVRTYTVGFDEADFDERAHARRVAEYFGTRHTEAVLRPDGLGTLPRLVQEFDEPFADSTALPCFQIAEVVAKELKVCLSGDGGDEAFGGYDAYRLALKLQRLDRVPLGLRRLFLDPVLALYPRWLPGRGLLGFARRSFADRYVEIMCGFDNAGKAKVLTREFLRMVDGHDSYDLCRSLLADDGVDPLSRMQAADYRTYLPDDILVKSDRTSMSHSLELRVPFVDHEVFAVARQLPAGLKIRHGSVKRVLREAMKGLLPAATVGRSKRGFGVPLKRWLGGDLGRFATEVFSDPRTGQRGILCVPELMTLLRDELRGRRALTEEIWAALFLELWCRHYLDQPAHTPESRDLLGEAVPAYDAVSLEG